MSFYLLIHGYQSLMGASLISKKYHNFIITMFRLELMLSETDIDSCSNKWSNC